MRTTVFFWFFGIVLLDQGTKYLSPTYTLNPGISFGLFQSGILTALLGVILLGIAVKFGRQFLQVSEVATGIFFGASLSNILDRILFGGVRDFLPVPLLSVQNNLADWAIILSLLWLFFRMHKTSPGK